MFLNRAVTAAAIIGGAFCIILSILFSSGFLIAISAFFFCLSIAIWKYGYLLIPPLTKATNIIEVRNGFEIPPTRDYIVKKTQSGYYVTKYLEVRFYESSMDKENEEKKILFDSFEKAISSLKYIVRISLMISTLELSSHIEEIKTKRGSVEAKKSKEGKISDDEKMRMDRELAYWNRLLDRISSGDRPVEVIAFAATTANGLTREEALSRASRQAKELKTILSSSLGCDINELKDLDMIRCFEWEFFNPTSQEEIKDETF
ncbi:hypothetical protein HY990_03055 [Candidatus Micrarchaeota archaeon]|nr:hypothetical protein [Candidatus Micrarchaeota archaeon]